MDADEFLNMFLDRIENLVKGTKQENFIKETFGGVLSNELICKGCPHYSEREEVFNSISLQVKNKKTLQQSLAAFVEGEMLEGDNAYMCSTCNKKVNTLKRTCLKKLPNNLIIAMKRFEFDYESMVKVKVNDYCEFPTKINLEAFTQQGLRKAEKAKKGDDSQENESENPETKEYPTSYFEYKLSGIVIHIGTADMGHYYSLIQDRELPDVQEEKKWYEFNDTIVQRFDPKDIPSEAYGGEEKWRYYSSDSLGGNIKEKIKNAYLLIYERVTHFEPEGPTKKAEAAQDTKKAEESKEDREVVNEKESIKGSPKNPEPEVIQDTKEEDDPLKNIPKEFYQSIMEKNQLFHVNRFVFSKEYVEFISDLILHRTFTPNPSLKSWQSIDPQTNPKEYYDVQLIITGCIFLLTVVLRERVKNGIISLLPKVKKLLSENVPASSWLLSNFTHKKTVSEFLLDCPVADMRRFIVGIVSTALRCVHQAEIKSTPEKIFVLDKKNDKPASIVGNFINCCINNIFESRKNMREYSEFFKLFVEIASLGPECVQYLVQRQVIGRFMDFFYDQISPMNDYFRDMSDVPFDEPEDAGFGIPPDEKVKVRASWEDLILKRKDRNMQESHMAHKSYMWKALYLLLKYCRMNSKVPKSPLQKGDLSLEIANQEKSLLYLDSIYIARVIGDASQRMAYRNIADIYAYLCYEDPKFSSNFILAIKRGIEDGEYTSMRAYFRCILTVLKLNDSLAEKRCKELCSLLLTLLEENKGFFIEMDYFSSFLLKILTKVQSARDLLISNKDTWDWIITWLAQHPEPPFGMNPGNLRMQKKRGPMGYSLLRYDLHEYKARSALKIKKFKEFLSEAPPPVKDGWDSDDDLSEHDFQPGQKIDFDVHSNNKWITGEVEQILEEMVNIAYIDQEKDTNSTWTARDAENIAPHRAMQEQQEEINEISTAIYLSRKESDKEKQMDDDVTRFLNYTNDLGYVDSGNSENSDEYND